MLVEKEMATHSNILAWRIPWTEEAYGLQSTGLPRVGHDWVTKCACILCYITINAMMRWKRTIRKPQEGSAISNSNILDCVGLIGKVYLSKDLKNLKIIIRYGYLGKSAPDKGCIGTKVLKEKHCLACQRKDMKRLWWSELDERVVGQREYNEEGQRLLHGGWFSSVQSARKPLQHFEWTDLMCLHFYRSILAAV